MFSFLSGWPVEFGGRRINGLRAFAFGSGGHDCLTMYPADPAPSAAVTPPQSPHFLLLVCILPFLFAVPRWGLADIIIFLLHDSVPFRSLSIACQNQLTAPRATITPLTNSYIHPECCSNRLFPYNLFNHEWPITGGPPFRCDNLVPLSIRRTSFSL